MRARLRAPGGTSTIILPDDATVGDLIAEISEKTSITKFDIKYGYPPKPLLLDQNQRSQLLKELGVKLDGEQLTISPRDVPLTGKPAALADQQRGRSRSSPTNAGTQKGKELPESFSFGDITPIAGKQRSPGPVSLQKKTMEAEVPEIPMPERGATLGRVSDLFSSGQLLTLLSASSHAR